MSSYSVRIRGGHTCGIFIACSRIVESAINSAMPRYDAGVSVIGLGVVSMEHWGFYNRLTISLEKRKSYSDIHY